MACAGRKAPAAAVMRFVAVIVVSLWAGCFANEAFAHAALVSVQPSDGSVLTAPPKRVELHFNESVVAGAVTLVDADGQLRDDATVDAKNEMISVAVPADVPRGTTVVSYRVISQDGHPVSGSVAFSIGAPSATKPPEANQIAVNAAIWLARIGVYLG